VLAGVTGDTRFERDAVPGRQAGHRRTHLDDLPGALVSQDQRLLDDVVADPPVQEVVQVRTADTDPPHRDEHLLGPR